MADHVEVLRKLSDACLSRRLTAEECGEFYDAILALSPAGGGELDLGQFREAVNCWRAVITTAAVNLPFNLAAYRASCGVSVPDRLLALIDSQAATSAGTTGDDSEDAALWQPEWAGELYAGMERLTRHLANVGDDNGKVMAEAQMARLHSHAFHDPRPHAKAQRAAKACAGGGVMHPSDFKRALMESNWFNSLNRCTCEKDQSITCIVHPIASAFRVAFSQSSAKDGIDPQDAYEAPMTCPECDGTGGSHD